MQSTELSCPHCGSTLNFGLEILAGTPVECMICMQTFTAAPKPVPAKVAAAAPAPAAPKAPPAPQRATPAPVASAPIAVAKTPPKAPALVAAPYSAPASAAIAAGDAPPFPASIPQSEKTNSNAARPIAKPSESFDPSKLILAAIAAGLFFILTGGLAFAVWKIALAVRTPSDTQQLASDGKSGAKDKNKDQNGADPVEDPDSPAAIEKEGKKEFDKILLARKKNLFNGGDDLNFDAVNTIKIPKQAIPGLDQQKIDAAIDKGVIYLKKSQQATGTWGYGHTVGEASLGGLTLLECGVPANDFFVQRAAGLVRGGIAKHTGTYEISLAILFLDRLGDPRDQLAIQALALRLLAGQHDGGDWGYACSVLSPDEMYLLFSFLNSHRQPNLQNPLGANPKLQNPIQREGLNPDDPFLKLHEMMLGHAPTANPPKGGVVQPPNPKNPPIAKGQPVPPNWLRAELQNLPVVRNQGKAKGKGRVGLDRGGDNSNTQFAILALWAARRHGVPTDQALLAAYQRFEKTQGPEGGWGYHGAGNSPAMTGVGLLGEAMGHGVAPEILAVNPKNPKQVLFKPVLEDPTIQKGLTCFSKFIGQPSMDPKKTNFPMENLYFLWTVERVAMLYDLKTINGKDWYGWGAQILVHNQNAEGAWANSSYPGANPSVNTCFALLFLKRSNLVQDLTNNLRLHSAIPDAPK